MSTERLKMVDDKIGSCTLNVSTANSSVPSGTYPPVLYLPHKARPSATRTRTFNSITRHRDWRRLEFVPSRFQRGERERACLDRLHFFSFLFFHGDPLPPRPFSAYVMHNHGTRAPTCTFILRRRDDRFSCVRSLNRSTSILERPILTTGLHRFTRKPTSFE